MKAKLFLDGKEVVSYPIYKIRNEIIMDILHCRFSVAGGVYIKPFALNTDFKLEYYTDEDELLDTFFPVKYYSTNMEPTFNKSDVITEVEFYESDIN